MEWNMGTLFGCEHCGFVTGTHGYIGSSAGRDLRSPTAGASRACPECGAALWEMGPIEAGQLMRERQQAKIFRSQALPRNLGERDDSQLSSDDAADASAPVK
jgi:predicted RNA-binding Zn-ribbon protein involved in translation (DUF1610 family)